MWRSSPPVRLGIGVKAPRKRSGKLHKNGRRHGRMQCFLFYGAGAPVLNYDKLSRSNEEANSLSKEDVIEIEGIVREAMPNAIFKVEMLRNSTYMIEIEREPFHCFFVDVGFRECYG